ncbi:MAG: 1,4-beta-xylanase [Ignavibacteriota bacterium]
MIGANYIQSNTVNQIEMWQADSFDADRIDMELGWAEALGINTLRVTLQELVWEKDSSGMQNRMRKLLSIADKHKMKVIFVLFDSSGDPYPEPGRQRQPRPGVRNSLWVQSPGAKALTDPKLLEDALNYVSNVVATFSVDKRVLAWDVWNEPDNTNSSSYANSELPNKAELVRNLLPTLFKYARAGVPSQPVTSGLWKSGDWSSMATLSPIEKIQIEQSDFISFQNYDGPEDFEKRVKWLQAYGRPVLCTGFLARNQGNSIETILPIALKYSVGALVGDLVQGKTQRFLPWDSWKTPYVGREPSVWSQDLFHTTGPLYRQQDADVIKKMIASAPKPVSGKPNSKKPGK